MDTPIMNQKSNNQSIEESTISRQTRNAFLTSVIFIIAVFGNLVISLQTSLSTKTIISAGDTITVFIFFIITIYSARMIRQGQKEKGIWLLLRAFILTMALRNALTAGLGLIFGIVAFSLVPIIGLLTLKPETFGRVLSLGFISASFYLTFDIIVTRYLPPYRLQAESAEALIGAITIGAILIIAIFIAFLLNQHRFLLLSSKIILAMVIVVLIPIVILAIANSNSLQRSIGARQNEIMQTKAAFIAQGIDNLIRTNKREMRAEAQSPAIVEYISQLNNPGDREEKIRREEQALESLRSFRQKNILVVGSYAILDISGKNILDTTFENLGNDEHEEEYFSRPIETNLAFVSNVIRTRTLAEFSSVLGSSEYAIYFSAPIKLKSGEVVGVLRAEYHPYIMQQEISNYLEAEGEDNKEEFIALISEKEVDQIVPEDPSSVFLIISNGAAPELNFKSATPLTTNIITPLQMDHFLPVGSTAQLSLDVPGLDEGLRNRAINPVFEAQAFPRDSETVAPLDLIASVEVEESSLPWIVIISQDLKSINAPIQRQNDINTLIAIATAIGATILAYGGSQYLTRPVLRLAETVDLVAKGDLKARAIITTEDEIGALGKSFNMMTDQINTLISTLEDRVADRTRTLERRAEQLRAATAVGHAAASLRDLDQLLSQATELISQQFGFYHAGIFLIDTNREYAVLKAANSLGGLRMLARTHKLKVGEEGIVGYVTSAGEARIALDVGQDSVFFNNPDLPHTRSEMALPLIAGGIILGALDIQSQEGEAFGEADMATLQVLADQLAISIENAHLFEESRIALDNVRRAYGEQSHLGWRELLKKGNFFGYRSISDGSIIPLEEKANGKIKEDLDKTVTETDESNLTANIPIIVRGQSVGTIRLSKPKNSKSWDQKDLELAQTLTVEISQAMDSARLFDESRQQAERERVVGEIASRMQETMNVESVVRLATDELYKLLELDHVTIHLLPDDKENEEIE